jgi:hypothetical protein
MMIGWMIRQVGRIGKKARKYGNERGLSVTHRRNAKAKIRNE